MQKKFIIPSLLLILLIYCFVGFYTIQPIGALPRGLTLLVLKSPSDPFFNSPDAESIRRTGGVSLFSRAMALGHGTKQTILARLPYIETFYRLSVNGREFDR